MTKQSVAKNTVFMMMASVGQKIISLSYFTLLARELGAEKLGMYTAALAMTTIFVVFVDLGYTNVFIREASKDSEKTQEYFSSVLFAKLFFGILSYLALVVVVHLLGFEHEFRLLVYLSGITMLFDSLHLTIYGAMRAYGNLKYEAFSLVGSQLVTLILGLAFLKAGMPILYLILAFTIASAANVVYATIVAYRKYGLAVKPIYDKIILKRMTMIAVPFALAAIFGRMYSYVDVILLKKIAGDAAVGFYGTPSKITFAFQFIPLALIAALYPRFSEQFAKNKEKLARLFELSMKFLLVVALPISVGIFVLAEDIVLFAFTAEYTASIVPLKILVISLMFSFLSFPIGAFLNACSRQKAQTAIAGIVLVVNIASNLYLVPRMGAVGAAYSALMANILLGVLGYMVVPQITKISHSYIFKTFTGASISAFIMGIVVYTSNAYMHFLLTILIGAVVYPICLYVTKTLTKRQVGELFALIRR